MTAENKHAVFLKPGYPVLWSEKAWVIVDTKDSVQALCQPMDGGPRKFIPIIELKPFDESHPSLALIEGVELKPLSKAEQHARARHLRNDKHESTMSEREKFAHAHTLLVFEWCKRILLEPHERIRRVLTMEMAHELGMSQSTAYRRISAAKRHDRAAALKRSIRKDAGERKHPEEAMKLLQAALARHRFTATKKTVHDIKTILDKTLKDAGFAPMSRSFIYREIGQTTHLNQLKSEGRLEEARNRYKQAVGNLPNTDFPLQTVQVDHSPVQLTIVDSKDRRSIGDAWLTLVIDCYSRMILGFLLSLNAPSTHNYGMALAHAFLPKENYLLRLGVVGSWPCWGIADLILTDNAAEFSGYMIRRARRRHKITTRLRPVGQPQFGGHVESVFGTFMSWIESLPGTKFSNPKKKAEYDNEGSAVFTLDEFERLFADYVVNEYHLREHSGEGMNRRSPLQRWNAGIHDGDVMPARDLPPIPPEPEQLRISLLPLLGERVIKKGHLKAFNHIYYSHELASLCERLDARPTAKGRAFEIRYDPRNIKTIWMDLGPEADFLPVSFADLSLGPVSFWENKMRRKRLGRPAAVFDEQRGERAHRAIALTEISSKATQKANRLRSREREKQLRGEVHRAPALRKATLQKVPATQPAMDADRRAKLLKRLPKLA